MEFEVRTFTKKKFVKYSATEIYGVSSVRSLSEGITGYEVRTSSLYGQVTGVSEGSLYIDVDTDSHSVVSLNGEEDAPREYIYATGMISSLYESTVWEQLTGYDSVSTISILAAAQEENIDILLISGENLDTELEKLNTDETTRQEVINAVNSGQVVTIPAEDVTMGDWHGTGYIVTNPETGVGAYMISGGLNGGIVKTLLGIHDLLTTVGSAVVVAALIEALIGILSIGVIAAGIIGGIVLGIWFALNYIIWTDYMDFVFIDNCSSAEGSYETSQWLLLFAILVNAFNVTVISESNKETGI